MSFERTITLDSEGLRRAKILLESIPIDGSKQIVLRDYQKPSSFDQQKRMFGYVVGEIAAQAFIERRQFSVEVWHEHLKEKFLPEAYTTGITRKGYVKWLEMPNGKLKMVGSTTMLTTKGHGEYVTAVEAYGAQELGVRFSADRRVGRHKYRGDEICLNKGR